MGAKHRDSGGEVGEPEFRQVGQKNAFVRDTLISLARNSIDKWYERLHIFHDHVVGRDAISCNE